MASNRRSLTILGLLAVGLLALFLASVVCRSDGGGPGGGCSPGEREAWRARLLRPRPVARGQLGGCTRVPGVFTVARSCELTIAPADARFRRLAIQAIDPVEVTRTADADGRRITTRAELDPGEDAEIFVGEEGGAVRLRCRAGVTCRARVR